MTGSNQILGSMAQGPCGKNSAFALMHNLRHVSTAVFLTYVKRETDVYVRKISLVDIGFLLTGQRTRLVPFRPTKPSASHPSDKTGGGQIGSVDTDLYPCNTNMFE